MNSEDTYAVVARFERPGNSVGSTDESLATGLTDSDVQVHTLNVRCRVLVGADGIYSAVRAALAPPTPLAYLGVLVVLGWAEAPSPAAGTLVHLENQDH